MVDAPRHRAIAVVGTATPDDTYGHVSDDEGHLVRSPSEVVFVPDEVPDDADDINGPASAVPSEQAVPGAAVATEPREDNDLPATAGQAAEGSLVPEADVVPPPLPTSAPPTVAQLLKMRRAASMRTDPIDVAIALAEGGDGESDDAPLPPPLPTTAPPLPKSAPPSASEQAEEDRIAFRGRLDTDLKNALFSLDSVLADIGAEASDLPAEVRVTVFFFFFFFFFCCCVCVFVYVCARVRCD